MRAPNSNNGDEMKFNEYWDTNFGSDTEPGSLTSAVREIAEKSWHAALNHPRVTEDHPFNCIHMDVGSVDEAADQYEREYWSEQAQRKADNDAAKGALQSVGYYVTTIIGAMQSSAPLKSAPISRQEPSAEAMSRRDINARYVTIEQFHRSAKETIDHWVGPDMYPQAMRMLDLAIDSAMQAMQDAP